MAYSNRMNLDVSASMHKVITNIQTKIGKDSAIAEIMLIFSSPDADNLELRAIRQLKSLTIDQNFIENYTDKITGSLRLTQYEFELLYHLRNNAYCQLKLYYDKPDSSIESQLGVNPTIDKSFHCVFPGIENAYNQFTAIQRHPDMRGKSSSDEKEFDVPFELIDDTVFKARKQQLHYVSRLTTIEEAIRFTIAYFGFKKAVIDFPDNTDVYTNLVVPPAYGIENIMSFYQNAAALGVYNNGFCSYITDGCWYVYPRFGIPIKRCPIHVYNVGEGKFIGMNKNDYSVDKDGILEEMHVIINSGYQEKDWSTLGSENAKTCSIVQLTGLIPDHTRILESDDSIHANPQYSMHAIVPEQSVDPDNFTKVEHAQSNDNIYKIRSELRTFQGKTVKFNWNHARPWTFRPATVVQIHYDNDSGFKTLEGMCERALYTYELDRKHPLLPRFTCTGNITVNCSVTRSDIDPSNMLA